VAPPIGASRLTAVGGHHGSLKRQVQGLHATSAASFQSHTHHTLYTQSPPCGGGFLMCVLFLYLYLFLYRVLCKFMRNFVGFSCCSHCCCCFVFMPLLALYVCVCVFGVRVLNYTKCICARLNSQWFILVAHLGHFEWWIYVWILCTFTTMNCIHRMWIAFGN